MSLHFTVVTGKRHDANHIHSGWREFNGDFGADLLREHVTGSLHDE